MNHETIETSFFINGWEIVQKDKTSFWFRKTDRGTIYKCFIVFTPEKPKIYCMVGNIGFDWHEIDLLFLADIEAQKRQLAIGAFLKTRCTKVMSHYQPDFYVNCVRTCVRCKVENTMPNPDISYCEKCIKEIADNLFKKY